MSETDVPLSDEAILTLAMQTPLPPSTDSLAIELEADTPKTPQSSTSRRISETFLVETEDDAYGNDRRANESSLPSVDRGIKAWTFLTAAFFMEAIVWGFPNSFGVFLDAYLTDPKYATQSNASSLLPLIGPLSSGIMYCSGPLINTIISRWSHRRRLIMWSGTVLCWASLFGASYTTKVKLLVFLQGVLYAVGGSLLYYPCISYMSEWFVERRGLANGVMFAGASTGGLILPLILPYLISSYGSSKALRILGIAITGLLVPFLPFVKGRLPELRYHVRGPGPRGLATGSTSIRKRDWLKNTTFWVLIIANTFQGFGYFVPILWLPTFANALKLSSANAAIALSMLNGASVVGRLSMGYLSDKLNPWLLALSTLICTSLSTFILWGVLSTTFAGLLSFGIAYGALAGGWSSLWTGFLRPLTSDDPRLATTLLGYLMLSRGIGNIFSTPISSALSSGLGSNSSIPNGSPHHSTGFQVDNGKYEKMILYVGTCFAGAAVVSLTGWLREMASRRNGSARLQG
ncbi:hypothetical protein AAF712_008964 [Marasmius tenuissimus]|uniref:MFS general substrate transporter n=1 Tax=Marasmius tenuissimus TaxID=585030 RepID=A0ABR2ZTD0_9AGAR